LATIGEELKRERNRRGWAIKDVEQVLHIRAAYLEAIENDDFALIPGAVYTKGFIRNYANLLELDGQEYVDRYKVLMGEEINTKVRPVKRVKKQKKKEKEAMPEVSLERLSYEGRRRSRQKLIAQERIAAAVIVVLVICFFFWVFIF